MAGCMCKCFGDSQGTGFDSVGWLLGEAQQETAQFRS